MPTAELLGGRYLLSRLLKAESGVETHLALAVGDGELVVVKRARVDAVSTALGMRLEREAKELLGAPAGLLVDQGVDGGWWWLAQPFAEGTALCARLSSGALTVDETLRVAADVLATLVVAHERGVLHRDIKPANIVVTGEQAVTRAALIDFGLSRGPWRDPASEEVVTTARYCSPEQTGAVDAVMDERSDLYSLGAVLFECLAGRPLFEGASLGAVLRQQLSTPVPDLSTVGFDVPRVLAEMIDRLLRKLADERYQSAAGVLSDVKAIIAARSIGTEAPTLVIGSRDRRRTLAEPGFVGRSDELETLVSALGSAGAGRGGVVLVEGESGGGKSRLLAELARAAVTRGVLVMRGQGEDQSAHRPFQLFDGVAHDLATAAQRDPVLAESVRERLGPTAGAAVAASPLLSAVFPDADSGDHPDQFGQARTVTALARLLDACGGAGRPALVVLDDCQWAEESAARVLSEWSEGARARFTLVVAAYRSEEVPAGHPIRCLQNAISVHVGSMAEAEVRELIASMAGPVPSEAARTVVRMAAGSPFMAQAVLRGMVEVGALEPDDQGWRVDAEALRVVELSRRAALFLMRRLDLLSAPGQRLLAAAAVLGKEFKLHRAVALSGLDADAAAALDECRTRRIIWVDEADDNARFGHDKLREAVLARLGDAERARLHLRAARLLQAEPSPSPFELAFHLDAAGDPTEALSPAMIAAEQSRSRHALDAAEFYYRIARRGAPSGDRQVRVAEGLGEVLALAGRYDEAEAELGDASDLTDDPRRRAALEGKLGEVAFRRGDLAQAATRLEAALRQLGRWVPRRRVGYLLGAVWELMVQAVHTAAPRLRVGRRRQATEEELLAMRFYSRLAYAYWFRNGKVLCGWAHLREMNLAERFGPSLGLAQAYSEHAPVMTMIPWFSRGVRYARRSLQIRRELGDTWGQGQSLSFYGVVLYAASRYGECIEAFEEAARILAGTGDRWEMNTARWHLALAHYRLGDLPRAADIAADVHREAKAIGDHASVGIALSAWARATGGDVPADAVAAVLALHHEDIHTATEARLAEAIRRVRIGEPSAAASILEEAAAAVRAAGFRQEYVTPVWPWWATAIRLQLDQTGPGATERAKLVRRARSVARRATRLARSYRNSLPHALRERGLLEARAGRPSRARRLLDRSIAIAIEQGARWEETQSRHERARLGIVLGWPGSRDELAVAERTLAGYAGKASEASHPSMSLADRFAGLLSCGRTIASATTPAAILDSTEHAARTLLRCDESRVVLLDAEGLDPLDTDPLAAAIVRQAVAQGRPVSFMPDQAGRIADGLILADLGSVLCAPIVSDGRPVACLYVANSQVAGLFGPDEETLADFVTTLAGAALEHAEGSAAHFRALVQNASDITIVCDEDRTIRYVSPTVSRILAYTPEDLASTVGFGFVDEDDQGRLAQTFVETLTDDANGRLVEVRGTHADGTARLLELTHTNLCQDPAVRGVVINVHDVTERRAAENAHARLLQQFRVAFENAPVGMAFTSMRPESVGQLRWVNQALARMLGRSRDELEGVNTADITHLDDLDADVAAMARFRAGTASTFETEKRYRHADGHYVWVQLRAALMRDEEGQPDYAISQMADITERRVAEAQLASQALHDPLTGLPNRRMVLDRLTAALRSTPDRMAVLYLDLDQFKVINDSYGHDVGDRVLVSAARRLAALLTDRETLGRFGGDEFVILLEELNSRDAAESLARRIHAALTEPLTVSRDLSLSVTTSIGVAFGQAGKDGPALLRDADTALYRAKELGRARHEIFGEQLRERAIRRMEAERDLRAAIDEDRLLLHYQPIVELGTGTALGAEALIRYRRPSGEIVLPGEFIEISEQTGLIVNLGTWVIREACRQLAEWHSEHRELRRMMVNVSARQLSLPEFVDTVEEAVSDANLDPTALALEITETALVDSIEATVPIIRRLRAMGCAIGIDDFGTGYASFEYLRQLPVDFLKIDRSFISGLGDNPDDTTIVATLLSLAKGLDLSAVAEGVETEEQENRLRELGCNQAQGYRFARPAPADEIRAYLDKGAKIPR